MERVIRGPNARITDDAADLSGVELSRVGE